jgi:hypothetical protein
MKAPVNDKSLGANVESGLSERSPFGAAQTSKQGADKMEGLPSAQVMESVSRGHKIKSDKF